MDNPIVLGAIISGGLALLGTIYTLTVQRRSADERAEIKRSADYAALAGASTTSVLDAWKEMVRAQGEQLTAVVARLNAAEERLLACEAARVVLSRQLNAMQSSMTAESLAVMKRITEERSP